MSSNSDCSKSQTKGLHPKGELVILLATLDHGVYCVILMSGNVVESSHVQFSEHNFPGRPFVKKHDKLSDSEEQWNDDWHPMMRNSTCDSSIVFQSQFDYDVSTESSFSENSTST